MAKAYYIHCPTSADGGPLKTSEKTLLAAKRRATAVYGRSRDGVLEVLTRSPHVEGGEAWEPVASCFGYGAWITAKGAHL